MSWTEIEIDETGRVTVRRGGTLTGETEPKPKTGAPITKPASAESIVEISPVTRPAETESTVECSREDSKEPEPEPKPKLVTWRRCVRIRPNENLAGNFYAEWYPEDKIPRHWYPVEAHEQPIQTVKRLPEGETP